MGARETRGDRAGTYPIHSAMKFGDILLLAVLITAPICIQSFDEFDDEVRYSEHHERFAKQDLVMRPDSAQHAISPLNIAEGPKASESASTEQGSKPTSPGANQGAGCGVYTVGKKYIHDQHVDIDLAEYVDSDNLVGDDDSHVGVDVLLSVK